MKHVIAASVLVFASGCATQSFVVNDQPELVPTEDVMQPFFIEGLGQTQEVNAAEICGGSDQVAKIETKNTFMNGLLGVISSGIYTPRQAKVYCVDTRQS